MLDTNRWVARCFGGAMLASLPAAAEAAAERAILVLDASGSMWG